MCDYSLMHVKSQPAKVGEKLQTSNFGTGTRGFAAPDDPTTAVCVLPGTELAFDGEISVYGAFAPSPHKTAIFRQINQAQAHMHHDALELPDGHMLLDLPVRGPGSHRPPVAGTADQRGRSSRAGVCRNRRLSAAIPSCWF
jgi:hypothetical protein